MVSLVSFPCEPCLFPHKPLPASQPLAGPITLGQPPPTHPAAKGPPGPLLHTPCHCQIGGPHPAHAVLGCPRLRHCHAGGCRPCCPGRCAPRVHHPPHPSQAPTPYVAKAAGSMVVAPAMALVLHSRDQPAHQLLLLWWRSPWHRLLQWSRPPLHAFHERDALLSRLTWCAGWWVGTARWLRVPL